MHKYIRTLLISAALTGPAVACAVRIYDEPRHDYHRWNAREERAYHVYLTERRREYREFSRLNQREQEEYWDWRHTHSDRELDRDRGRDRDHR
jgi:hypothetical protein